MGIFPFLGATKLHIHLKTSQYFLNIITHKIYLYIYNTNIQILIKEMEGIEGGKMCYNLQELEQRVIV